MSDPIERHARMRLADARAARPGILYYPCVACGDTWSSADGAALDAFAAAHVRGHGYEPGEALHVGDDAPASRGEKIDG